MIAGAIDFGGTKLIIGLVDDTGRVLSQKQIPTPVEEGPEIVAETAAALLTSLCRQESISLSQLDGVGATVPGLVDKEGLQLRWAPTHGWKDIPFAEFLSKHLGVSAVIANDVNACALAEQKFGAGKGVDNLLWMTISTGIGGGLIVNGEIYPGGSGIAGEVGHIVIEEDGPVCGCGNRGCLQAVASGTAITRRAREAGLAVTNSGEAAKLARQGDDRAIQVFREAAVYLGRALSFCFNILNPDIVVLGGGVAQSLDLLLPVIHDTVKSRIIHLPESPPRIVATALGYEAALLGASALVFSHIGLKHN
jgi:glucokinase